jgi:hypothetical protein
MRKQLKKNPREMTDEEALKHLFHPEIVKAIRKHAKGEKKTTAKRKSKVQP